MARRGQQRFQREVLLPVTGDGCLGENAADPIVSQVVSQRGSQAGSKSAADAYQFAAKHMNRPEPPVEIKAS